MMKSKLGGKPFAASLAVLLMAVAASGAARAESLGDAIAMAYAQNPTLVRARAQQRAADEGYVQARSSLGPSLSAGASTDYADHNDVLGNRSYTGLSLSAAQTLFASGGLSSTLAASKATVLSGQQSLRSTEQGVLLDVIDIYTAVQRDQQALKISQDNYDILKQQLDQTQAQFDAGQLTRTDVAQSQARLAASAASLASAQAQLDTDRAAYVAIVGQAPTALDPVPTLPGLPTDLNAALDAAQKNNPDMQAATYAEQSAADRVRAARSVFGPTIGLSAQSGYSAPTNHLGTLSDSESTSITARLSIPLFSAGLNGSRVREAKENLAAQTATVELTRRSVVSTVSQAWSQMLAARSAVTSNEEQVKAAQIAADGVKTEQQVGLRTNIEVLNAEQDLKNAQLALIEAQRNEYLAGSQLLSVMGALDAQAFAPDIQVYDPQANFDKVKNKGWSPLEPVARLLDGLVAGK
jgi:outer membrane protein